MLEVCIAPPDVALADALAVPVALPIPERPKLEAPGVGVELTNEETLVGKSLAKGTILLLRGVPCNIAGCVAIAGTGLTFDAL